MNGPQHYAEAERTLAVAEGGDWQGDNRDIAFAQTAIAAAQVHATLALAAATVDAAGAMNVDWTSVTRGGAS